MRIIIGSIKKLWLQVKLRFQIAVFKYKSGQMQFDFIHQQFGLSYASWMVMPRVLMEAMPDEWQKVMVDLWEEFYDTWDMNIVYESGEPYVQLRKGGRFVSIKQTNLPHYRRPGNLDEFRRKTK